MMNNSETQPCKNCGTLFDDMYCNHCGQKKHHRFTLGHVWHEALHAVTHADKGFPYLMVQLFIRPGVVAREYIIDGRRKKYFNPLTYALILGSIAAFIAVNSHYMEHTMRSVSTSGAALSASKMKKLVTVMQYANKYYNVFHLLQVPFFALGTWLLYRSRKLFYAEHLMLHCFQAAQTTVVAIAFMVLLNLTAAYLNISSVFVSIFYLAYFIWMVAQFFKEQTVAGYLKAALAYLLGFVFYLLFAVLVGLLGLFIYIIFFEK
jgi:Protein of unknown function (DUF3667)